MSDDAWRGATIREARKNKGFTQEHLGDLVGVTPQAVSKWENGESAPDINTVPLLCDTLGISVDAFLRSRGTEVRSTDPVRRGYEEWLGQQREHHGSMPSLGAVFRQLVAVVQDTAEPSRQGSVLEVVMSSDCPNGITLLTHHGSVLHWAGAADLPDSDVSDDAIADALKFLADPDVIGFLRALLSAGTSGFKDGGSGHADARGHPAYSRLLQEGYVSYHQFGEEEQIQPMPKGVTVAATILLLAAVLGLGRHQTGRGLNLTLMSGGRR